MTYTRAIAAVIDWLNKRLPKPANRMPYTGEWKDNKRHGQGTMTWADGSTYTGEWQDGQPHGQGTRKYSNAGTYTGEWQDGQMHGQITMTYADGTVAYIGEWKDGVPVP